MKLYEYIYALALAECCLVPSNFSVVTKKKKRRIFCEVKHAINKILFMMN